ISASSEVVSPSIDKLSSFIIDLEKTLGPDGKPVTSPRGIVIGSPKIGKLESSFFSKVGYVTIGKITANVITLMSIDDKYSDPLTRERKDEMEKRKLN